MHIRILKTGVINAKTYVDLQVDIIKRSLQLTVFRKIAEPNQFQAIETVVVPQDPTSIRTIAKSLKEKYMDR